MVLIERFVVLAKVDARRLDLERRIARGPLQLQQEDARGQKARDTITKLKDDGKRAGLETKRLEGETKAKQQELEKTQIAQNQAKQNEEFKAHAKKIDSLKVEIEALETKTLEEYERAEKRVVDLAAAEKGVKVVEQEVAAARKKIEAEQAALKAELEKVRAERTAAEKGIDGEALGVYTTVLQQHGDSALARVDGNSCSGCNISVRPNQLSILKGREQLVTCWQCNRILYLE